MMPKSVLMPALHLIGHLLTESPKVVVYRDGQSLKISATKDTTSTSSLTIQEPMPLWTKTATVIPPIHIDNISVHTENIYVGEIFVQAVIKERKEQTKFHS